MTSSPTDAAAPETQTRREFATIGVVGLGTMGAGIAEVFARNGFSVVGVEVSDEAVEHFLSLSSRATVLAVGPGLTSDDERTRRFVRGVAKADRLTRKTETDSWPIF